MCSRTQKSSTSPRPTASSRSRGASTPNWMRPVQTQAGFTVLPNYSFTDRPAMDAFLIPGGFGTRQEMHNTRLHEFIRSLPENCLLTSVCTGSWIYARMGLLDGKTATNRKEPDRLEASAMGKVPIDRLAEM